MATSSTWSLTKTKLQEMSRRTSLKLRGQYSFAASAVDQNVVHAVAIEDDKCLGVEYPSHMLHDAMRW